MARGVEDRSSFLELFVLAGVAIAAIFSHAVNAQSLAAIEHRPATCIPRDRFLVLSASVRPDSEVRSVRLYFRAAQFPLFSYLDMERGDAGYAAVLPIPALETRRVVYYIEAVTQTFASTRTEQAVPEVKDADECKQKDPAAVYYPGANPGIIVHSLSGAALLPPGFLATGLTLGGGVGVGTLVGIGAGVGAGVGIIVAGGGDEAATTTVISGPPSTSVTTTAPPGFLKACFEMTPPNGVITAGNSVRMDATCSEPRGSIVYGWDLGDGRAREELRVINPIYSNPGVYRVTLLVKSTLGSGQDEFQRDVTVLAPPTTTVPGGSTSTTSSSTSTSTSTSTSSTTSTTSIPLVPADLSVTIQGPGAGIPVGGSAQYLVTATNNFCTGCQDAPRVLLRFRSASVAAPASAITATDASCSAEAAGIMSCDFGTLALGASRSVTFTATFGVAGNYANYAFISSVAFEQNSANNTATLTTIVALRTDDALKESSFSSSLSAADGQGGAQGQVTVNGARADVTDSSGPFTHRISAKAGEHRVEAVLASPTAEGLWRFDFSGAERFEPASILVESGEVISLDTYSVVFRVREAGERVKFRFRLKP